LIACGSTSPEADASCGPKYRGGTCEHAANSIAAASGPIIDFTIIPVNLRMPTQPSNKREWPPGPRQPITRLEA
jgi:hypothetical protein